MAIEVNTSIKHRRKKLLSPLGWRIQNKPRMQKSTGFTRPAWVSTIKGCAAFVNYRAPARKKSDSSNCFKKRQEKADRVHQIKLLHASLSKSIIWEMSEMEPQESKSANKPDYKGSISLQSGSQFQRKNTLRDELRQNQTISNFSLHKL